ncbi:hypothetical protein PPL_00279 [Heterostelium album PN500]|uniref:lipoate--protein ligase n=1 Tax=Heterostelium pallidum (strain ATCC 26659 / Pp 5 / PN500) TaxID=670386 RepID=D3AW12_HETP5|nr:hypothetical protein PPL_00279 [Heterostelium album PN500]EFA86485.1 hypothetical protein PPL_00279 [Heterostelium album PN500]|eukprot:XP_020438590.1 hypothetical protein PPL_00279 [Heterostelium album PN500]
MLNIGSIANKQLNKSNLSLLSSCLRKTYCSGTNKNTNSNNNNTNNNASASTNLKASAEKIKVYKSTTDDALFNIATEDWLFKTFDLTTQTLFLWRNGPTCIIGRHQNPFKECHLQQMEKDGVTLARRYSGGGAVYQDHGNSIYTLLSPTTQYDKHRNTAIVIDSLRQFGINAESSGRNDVIVDGNRKGISSVVSRVCNLKTIVPDITHERWCESMIESFFRCYGKRCDIEELSRDDLYAIPSLKEVYDGLSNWEWRFGATPEFDHQFETRFQWGIIDMNINSNRGVINDCKVYSDSLNPVMIENIASAMIGETYSPQGISNAIEKTKLQHTFNQDTINELEELKQWLLTKI